MALKFRRGTTAQQSGSLAFGEPYVNTTLGTLVIGGSTGDIVLSSTGTGSTGNFGAISGSGLDITGNAKIAGNLTLGGAITIGDASADTVNVVASLSSSLIPSVTDAFDLGSPSKQWRDLYLSSASLYIDGTQVLSSNATELIFTTNTGQSIKFNELGTDNITLQTVDGDIELKSSGGGDILLDPTTGLISVKGNIAMQDGTAKFLSSGGNKIVFGNDIEITGSIVTSGNINGLNLTTLSSSISTTLGELRIATGSSTTSITNINSATASLNTSVSNLNTFSGSQLTKDSTLATYTGSVETRLTQIGVVSGSLITSASAAKTTNDSQDVSVTNLNSFTSSINTTIKSKLDTDGVISGSSQVVLSSTNGFSTYSTSVDSRILTEKGRVDAILSASTADVDTFAEVVALINSVDTTNDNAFASFFTSSTGRLNNLESTSGSVNISVSNINSFSGSAITRLGLLETSTGSLNSFTSSINTTIKARLDANTVVSGSSQISLGSVTGNSTTNVTEGTNLYFTDARVKTKLNAETVVSGSSQITAGSTTGFTTGVKTQLDANTVVSGSAQVIGILSSLNTYTGSNDTTNTTQNSRLDQLSTASGSAITRLSALEVETANLETFSGSTNTRLTEIGVVSGSLIASASAAKTTNDSQGVSITNLNSTTASLNTSVSNLNTFSGSALTRLSNLEGTDFTITLTGDVTGAGTVTNLGSVSFATTVAANSVALGTDTTGDYVASMTAGTGITVGTATGEGSTPVITNTGVTSNVAGTGISVSGGTGAVTITNSGVTSAVAGTGVSVSGATGAVTFSIGQSVATSASPTFAGLTINGAITATGDITAFFTSDKRHKNNIQIIPNALEKVTKLNGVTWEWNDDVNEVTKSTPKTGLIAQEVQEVLPEVVKTRDDGFLALDYSKMMGLMVEAIKEQQIQIEKLRMDLDNYECKCDNCKSK